MKSTSRLKQHNHSELSDHYKTKPYCLHFKNVALETQFRETHAENTRTQIRFALIVALVAYISFSYLDYLLQTNHNFNVFFVRFSIGLPLFLIPLYLSYKSYCYKHMQILISLVIYIAGISIFFMSTTHEESAGNLRLAGTLFPIFWAYLFSSLRFSYAIVTTFSLIISYELLLVLTTHYSTLTIISYNFLLVTCTLIGMLGGYTIEKHYRKDFVKNRLLDEKANENEKLLLNILPRHIAEQLKSTNNTTIAEQINEANIVFADLVGFTSIASKQTADKTVAMLNDIFTRFDALTEKFGLEKIKTIGDAYMAAGIHQKPFNTAENSILFAQAMLETLTEYNRLNATSLQLRVGIHSGAIIAGVIGKKKFIYDLWGDNVNIASRMESTGIDGCIQVSENIHSKTDSIFEYEDRGLIEIKGRGKMRAYILRSSSLA